MLGNLGITQSCIIQQSGAAIKASRKEGHKRYAGLRRNKFISPRTVISPSSVQGNFEDAADDILRYGIDMRAVVDAVDSEGGARLDIV